MIIKSGVARSLVFAGSKMHCNTETKTEILEMQFAKIHS